MSKINVLHILWTGRTGGAERFVRDIAAYSDKSKFRHAVCFLAGGGPLEAVIRDAGVCTYSLGMKGGRSVFQALKIMKVLKEFQPRIIHSHARNYFVNVILGMQTGLKKIYSEHGGCFEPTASSSDVRKYARVYKHFISRYDLALTNAEYLKEKIVEWAGLPLDRVKIYHYGIRAEDYGRGSRDKLRRELSIPEGSKVVGIVGRLVEQKGIDDFLRIAQEIRRMTDNVSFVVVGDGPLRGELERLSEQLQVNAYFTGDRRDLPEILPSFDVFVFTSKWEPFGIIILEALASGVPVVGFRVPGMEAIIEKGGGGILINERDHAKAAREVVNLLEHPDAAEDLAKQGRQNVWENFEVKKAIHLLENEYYGILSDS